MTQEDRTSAPAQKRTSPAAMLAMSKALAKVARETNDANLKKQAAELNAAASRRRETVT
jgi:hypothetical protein